ncbi:MAG: hypothetical protein MST00_04570 [Tenericutes bacterium]|nr:hypothetical protein [Mycoplasmatota bacterium]
MKKRTIFLIFIIGLFLILNMNVFADDATTETCRGLLGDRVMNDLEMILKYVRIFGPIIVVVYTTYDYIAAIINKDADEYKKVNQKLITRLILVVALFFLPILLNLLLSFINEAYTTCIN